MEYILSKKLKINKEKLISYGFKEYEYKYIYSKNILNNEFMLTITIDKTMKIGTEIRDIASNEIYTLHLVSNANGSFLGMVREEYYTILHDFEEKCCDKQVFQNEYTNKLIEYIKNKYGVSPEYLWEKFPNNAVFRRKDTKKWFAIIMMIAGSKIGIKGNDNIEVLDFRADTTTVQSIVDNKIYFQGYHMNKKHWLTIVLDNSISFEETCNFIDYSYNLAKK